MNVTQNLWDFLHVLASSYRDEWFWTDQLCIDQSDVQERGHQVDLMGDIFRAAKTVFAYTGPRLRATTKLNELEESLQFHPEAEVYGSITEEKTLNILKRKVRDWGSDHCFATLQTQLELCELLERKYWRRLWIVQELYLAVDIVILCGNNVVPLKRLKDLALELCRRSHPKWQPGTGLVAHLPERQRQVAVDWHMSDGHMYRLMDGLRGAPWNLMSLGSAIATFGSHSCAEPRDKIYGLQGIVQESQRLKADYTMSLGSIMRHIVLTSVLRPPDPSMSYQYNAIDGSWGMFKVDEYTGLRDLHRQLSTRSRESTENLVWRIQVRRIHRALSEKLSDSMEGYKSFHRQPFLPSESFLAYCRNMRRFAGNSRQRALAQQMHDRATLIHDQTSKDRVLESCTCSNGFKGAWFVPYSAVLCKECKVCEDTLKKVGPMLATIMNEALQNHGFVLEEHYILHPDDEMPFAELDNNTEAIFLRIGPHLDGDYKHEVIVSGMGPMALEGFKYRTLGDRR